MIRLGCFAFSKIGGIRSLLLPNRKFCDEISGHNSFNFINEIKQSLQKLELGIVEQNKFRNRQAEQQLEEMIANFDDLQENHQQFENKFTSLIKDMEEGNKGMKEAFDKLELECQLKIMRKKEHDEQQEPKMEEAKDANLSEQNDGNVNQSMKNNKWDLEDCGPKLTVSDGGLKVKHSGQFNGLNCVRAALPVPNFDLNSKSIISYFEVEIVEMNPKRSITVIGFCDKQFQLENKRLGWEKNSIGIWYKCAIHFDQERAIIGKYNGGFQARDIVGLGIHSPANSSMIKCFATCNGELLGMDELPEKFADVQLFPAINLYAKGDSIRANFGQKEWRFNF